MRYSALVNPVRGGLNIALAVPVLVLGHGAKGLAVVFLAVSVGHAARRGRRCSSRALPKAFVPAPASPGLRALLRFSLPQTLTTLLLQTILWTDSLLLGRLRPAAEVAVYAIVQRLLSPAQTDLDRDRPDVRAADRRRGRARRPLDAGGDAEARDLLERLARDPGLRAAAARARGAARRLRARLPDGRDGAHDPRRRPALQRRDRAARPGDQHVRPPVPDAREQRGGGGAEHRRLPDPDPALRPHRRGLLDDGVAHARQPGQARPGARALRDQPVPRRDGTRARGRPGRRRADRAARPARRLARAGRAGAGDDGAARAALRGPLLVVGGRRRGARAPAPAPAGRRSPPSDRPARRRRPRPRAAHRSDRPHVDVPAEGRPRPGRGEDRAAARARTRSICGRAAPGGSASSWSSSAPATGSRSPRACTT